MIDRVKTKKLINYISRYDIHYCSVKIYHTGEYFFIRFYNGGWSEYIDRLIRRSYRDNIILDDHPIMIIKLYASEYFMDNIDYFMDNSIKQEYFKYEVSYGEKK